jgi:superfamily II DNA or RNA helicase
MNLEIHNSYCRLTGDVPPQTRDFVRQVLTYRNDFGAELGQLFNQLRRFQKNSPFYFKTLKRIKFLQENEEVCWFKGDSFPTGHLNIVREALREIGSVFSEVDCRKVPTNDFILKWYNRPPTLRYYQEEMVNLGLSEGRGVFVAAVGSGKSLILGYIMKQLAVNSLVIVPSVGLGLQLEKELKSWFGAHLVETINTARVRAGKSLKPIRIATVQTLASLQKTNEIQQLVHDVSALFVDEIHHAGSASYTNLLSEIDHIYYRYGFTGTFLRNDGKSLDMWGFLSNVLYRYPAHKAISEGYLTPMEVVIHDMDGKPSRAYPKEYDNNYCKNPDLYMKVKSIVDSAGPDEQILILVKNKDKAGLVFHEYLNECGIRNAYISGDDKKEVINSTIQAFNDKKIRVLIGSSVIGEGIDVRSTDHLIMCQGGKSEIVIVQAVGRLVRLFEGKTVGRVHDFEFVGTRYMGKHLAKRVEIYARNFECPIKRVS